TQMQILLELLPNGTFNLRGAVAGIQATDPSGKIEKLVAIHILNHRALRTRGEYWRGVIWSARNSGLASLHQRFGIGPGNFGSKLNAFHDHPSLRGVSKFRS